MVFLVASLQGLTEKVIESYDDGASGAAVPDLSNVPFDLGTYSRMILAAPPATVTFDDFAPIDRSALVQTNGGSVAVEFEVQGDGTEAGLSLWLYSAGPEAANDATLTITPSGATGLFKWAIIDASWYSVDPATEAATLIDGVGNTFSGIYVGFDRSWELRRTSTPYPGTLRAEGTDATLVRSPSNHYLLRIETSAEASYLARVSAWQSPAVASRPAVRLYPRDDGRGMSSAPRIWPMPKSNRIIGGYQ